MSEFEENKSRTGNDEREASDLKLLEPRHSNDITFNSVIEQIFKTTEKHKQ